MLNTGEDVLWQFIRASRRKNDTDVFRKVTDYTITRVRKFIRTDKSRFNSFYDYRALQPRCAFTC